MTDFENRRLVLRSLLSQDKTLLVPGCYDGVSARLVETAGFPVVYIGSYATAASRLGLPDAGLAGMADIVQHAEAVASCVRTPVIADAENGFGNAANIWRTVKAFEKAGVSAIHIEDHEFGKHTNVKPVLLPLELMVQKIRAALDAREDPNFLIIARTDSYWAWNDPAETVRRLNAFADAGADLVFPAGIPATELQKIRSGIRGRVVMVNRPGATLADEERAGAAVVLYYGYALHAAYHGVKTALDRLKETRDAAGAADLLANVDEFEQFIGYPEFVERARRYGLCK